MIHIEHEEETARNAPTSGFHFSGAVMPEAHPKGERPTERDLLVQAHGSSVQFCSVSDTRKKKTAKKILK